MRKPQQAKESVSSGWGSVRRPRSTRLLTTGLLCLALPGCGGGDGGSGGSVPSSGGSSAELGVESLTFSPSQANTGDTIHVVDVIKNDGDLDAASFQIEIYLSADQFVTSADALIGLRSVGSLGPGQASVGGGFLTIPPTVTEGSWYLGVLVDGTGSVAEGNETDNVFVAIQTLEVSAAPVSDLAVTDIAVDTQVVEAGQTIGVSDTVQNIGVGAASSFQVGIYLSQDPTITPGDVLLGLRTVGSLEPGEISFMSSPLTVPGSTLGGLWFVGALADIGGVQNESDEFNNTAVVPQPIQITQPPRPDLRMTQLSFSPNELDAGQSLSINETVLNQGLVAASPFRVGIYLSADDQITSADHLIGFRTLAGLNVAESSSAAAPLIVPPAVGGGTFHVAAIADHEMSITESDEDNNSVIALGTVVVHVPPLPDLKTVAVAFTPNVVQTGESVTVVERIRNIGTVPAANVRVGTYLSSNEIVTTADALLGTRVISILDVGSEDEALSQYLIPAGLATGSWTVGVIVDDVDGILEPDEGNNLLVAAGHLDITGSPEPLPDLLVGALSASPSTLLVGDPMTVQSNIRNEGELSSGQFQVRFYLSEDEIIESTDHLVGVRSIFQLGIKNGSAQSFPYTIAATLPLGDYHFGALCDDPNVILESDEDNNSFAAPGLIKIYEPPPPAPDLTPTAFSFSPDSSPFGGPVQFSVTIKNVGTLDAGSYHVDYYLSEDQDITTADVWVGSGLTLPSLAMDTETPSSVELNLPNDATLGTWRVGAIVTIDSGLADPNVSNDLNISSEILEVTQ